MRLRITSFICAIALSSSVVVMAQQAPAFSTGRQVLANTEWHLVSMGPVGSSSIPVPPVRVTLKFGNDGRVSGSGGCNSYGGSYQVHGNKLTLSQVFSTKRACVDPAANKQESHFFAALKDADRFRLYRRQLTIYYGAGRNALDFASDNTITPDTPGPGDQSAAPVSALNDYYGAINAKEFEQAYSYWDSPSQSLAEFTRGFSDTAFVKLLLAPSPQIDGAAGSLYASISTILISKRQGGGERLFVGCYEMKKSNLRPEDGAQRQGWRIFKADVSAVSSNEKRSLLSRLCRR